MKDYKDYYTALLKIMKANENSAMCNYNDEYLRRFNNCLMLIESRLQFLLKQNKDYLLTDSYFYYITTSHDKDIRTFFDNMINHLTILCSEDKLTLLNELYKYFTFAYDEINADNFFLSLSLKNFLPNNDSTDMYRIMDIDRAITSLYVDKNIIKHEEAIIIHKILIILKSYAALMGKGLMEFETYIKDIFANIKLYLEKLEMNGMITKKQVYPFSSIEIKDLVIDNFLEYLINHINDSKKDKKNIK